MIIADTSGLLAFFNRAEGAHARSVAAVEAAGDQLVVSPFVIAELDYLVSTRLGVDAELAVLAELSGGAWVVPPFGIDDIRQAGEIIARYRDLDVGLADASQVVLADRFGTRRILTLDRRHFDVLRPLSGGRFSVLP